MRDAVDVHPTGSRHALALVALAKLAALYDDAINTVRGDPTADLRIALPSSLYGRSSC
jgi:hypothetical protein